eukprot:CAMPEP_0174300112 /NCGR_PEP_ID=MMETSP0809-20121228/58269_1 /TAXON_ID=73025 ORGANISM="Eutreptiella gymnastica-like, Strain CCMP1594" /NCGR_SAMPLE_ID=MMETSP0809 /ASSEMBLY_ACC=CAM_ASM_000658 /LENGTH=117 /DNA_ID=CAMNT_0015405645 /DNA_START=1430 /DNA_END=1783 /DNA_ORIENTATION=+
MSFGGLWGGVWRAEQGRIEGEAHVGSGYLEQCGLMKPEGHLIGGPSAQAQGLSIPNASTIIAKIYWLCGLSVPFGQTCPRPQSAPNPCPSPHPSGKKARHFQIKTPATMRVRPWVRD